MRFARSPRPAGHEALGALPLRYSRVAIALHWAIAGMFAVNLATGAFHGAIGPSRVGTIMGVHKSTGLLILLLTLGRIGWRLRHGAPPPPPGPAWQRRAAAAVHLLLYALMLGLPLSGWIMTSVTPTPRPLSFFWLIPLPFLPVRRSAASDAMLGSVHLDFAVVAAAAIALHVAAALKHHLVDRDRLLHRMLP